MRPGLNHRTQGRRRHNILLALGLLLTALAFFSATILTHL